MKIKSVLFSSLLSVACIANAQTNDINTPLHLMKPDYTTPYSIPTNEGIKSVIDRVFNFISDGTPMTIQGGLFRLTSYEWGVTYSALQRAAKTTNDPRYLKYVTDRYAFLAANVSSFRQVNTPQALDDAGAVCASMLKVDGNLPTDQTKMVDNYMDFILNKEYRLSDGTFARNRPQPNSVWLDDMFMAIPAVAYYAKYAKDNKYYDEAARQIRLFAEKMWVPEINLFRHGWVESMSEHPAFHWGRANGWAILTICEVLDALPADHKDRPFILDLYKKHVRGITALQAGDGFWHQLLNRNDSYKETSCTAIFTYALAHGINRGWLDAKVYGAVAQLGWNAVTTKISDKGEVIGTCVGTGMGFDPAFYYYRPTHTMAAHGYGPVIWAGAEMIEMLRNTNPKSNDSAIMYYDQKQTSTEPIFNVQ